MCCVCCVTPVEYLANEITTGTYMLYAHDTRSGVYRGKKKKTCSGLHEKGSGRTVLVNRVLLYERILSSWKLLHRFDSDPRISLLVCARAHDKYSRFWCSTLSKEKEEQEPSYLLIKRSFPTSLQRKFSRSWCVLGCLVHSCDQTEMLSS